jgi:hypothetical protein
MLEYSYKKKFVSLPDPVITKWTRRMHSQDNDVFGVCVGPRGSCKSGTVITLGYLLDRSPGSPFTRFYLDKKYYPTDFKLLAGERLPRTFFKPSMLLDMLKHCNHYPIATTMLWDEAGVEGDARDFAKKKNKLLKRVFQTTRSLNWALFLTAVTKKDYDVAFERNAGFCIQTHGKTTIETEEGEYDCAKTKVYDIMHNPSTGENYPRFMNYIDVDGAWKVLSEFYLVARPPSFLEAPYKRYKKIFQTRLYADYVNEIDSIDSFDTEAVGKANMVESVEAKVEEVLSDPSTFFDEKTKRFSLEAILFEGKIRLSSEALAKRVLNLIRFRQRKGKISFSLPDETTKKRGGKK